MVEELPKEVFLWEYRQLQPGETLVYKFVSKILLSNLIK